jgi:hypothetical protein
MVHYDQLAPRNQDRRNEETPITSPTQLPPSTADALAVRPCFWCNGSGRIPNDEEQRYDDCSVCEGSGTRPAPELVERIAA